MSQTPTTSQTSPETSPFVFTFGESSNTTTTSTSTSTNESMFVFTAGTMAAHGDALLTPETTQYIPLDDSIDGIVLSDVDSSAEQYVESDQEEKVTDEDRTVRRRVIIPPREMRNLQHSFQTSIANIGAATTEPVENLPPLPNDSDVENLDEAVVEPHVADEETADEETAEEEIADEETADEETADEETADEETENDSDDEDTYVFSAEIVDDTSIPIQPSLFPNTTGVLGEREHEIDATTEDDEANCSVCYCDLTVKNCVTALCGHTYCNKCFFRWMETNATCACCRRPFDSKTNLTDEQLDREYDECYVRYQHLLIRHNTALQRSNSLSRENSVLYQHTKNMMDRQIRLREMIDYSRGYNDGCVAAHDKIINNGKGIDSNCWKNKLGNNEWSNGFYKAYYHEKREIKHKMRKLEKINERKQTKRRRAFKNFNLSDDEEGMFV